MNGPPSRDVEDPEPHGRCAGSSTQPGADGHVALLVDVDAAGRAVHEVVPAHRRPDGSWLVLGTPALAWGCAAGDVLDVADGGAFSVRERGGNVAVVSYAEPGSDAHAGADVLRSLLGSRGVVEEDPRGRWLVATVPVAVGFPQLEAVLGEWQRRTGAAWSYGNVHDEDDRPLGWWT